MKRKLSAVEARKHFGEMLEGVHYRGDEVIIERAGKPMAVVIPLSRYKSMQNSMQSSRDEVMRLIRLNWEHNKDVPLEEIERDIEEAVRAVRAERRNASRPNE